MEVIKLDSFAISSTAQKPILRLRDKGQMSITSSAIVKALDGNIPEDSKCKFCYVKFGTKDNQLHIKISSTGDSDAIEFRFKKHLFVRSHLKLQKYLLTFTGEESGSIPCLISVNAVDEEGWMPVITTYHKR